MFSRGTIAIRLFGHAYAVHVGWTLAVVAVALATLTAMAPEGMVRSDAAAWYSGGVGLLLGLLGSLLVHEAGHVAVARRLGQRQPLRVRLYPFGGTGDGFSDPGAPGQDALIALGGPLASTLLAALFGIGWFVTPASLAVVRSGLGYLALGNGALTLVNLLPGIPLDGGRVFRALAWYLHDDFTIGTRAAVTYAHIISVFGLAAGFVLIATEASSGVWGLWIVVTSWALNRSAREEMTRAFFVVAGARLSAGETIEGMNPRVGADRPLDEVIETLLTDGHGGPALVLEHERVIGVLVLDRLRHFRRADWTHRTAANAMIPIAEIPQIEQSASVRDLLTWLTEVDADVLVVADHGVVVGAIDRRLAIRRIFERTRARERIRNP